MIADEVVEKLGKPDFCDGRICKTGLPQSEN